MHHRRAAGPPSSARIAGSPSRGVRKHPAPRRRAGRLVLGMALSTAVTGFVLAAPVVSTGPATAPMALDSSSTSSTSFTSAGRLAEETSPVVMGRDGAVAPSSAAAVPPPTEVAPEPTAATSAEAPATTETTSAEPETQPETASGTPAEIASETAETAAEVAASTVPSTSRSTTAAATSATTPGTGVEGAVLALVNTARAAAGCEPLIADAGLARVARAHSADMRDRDFFDHENPDGLDPFDRAEAAGRTDARAENIAHGQPTPADVMDAWMDSRGHRANILDCELRTLGVGVAEGPDGLWWTQLFGA